MKIKKIIMIHPGKELLKEIKLRGWTQKYFSLLLGKKVSEVNELIKGKRNITIQWDLLLSKVLGSQEKYWLLKQLDYDYFQAKKNFVFEKEEINENSLDGGKIENTNEHAIESEENVKLEKPHDIEQTQIGTKDIEKEIKDSEDIFKSF